MVYDLESSTQTAHMNYDLGFENDPLDEENYYSILDKDHL